MVNKEKHCPFCLDNRDSIFYSLSQKEKDILLKNHVCSIYRKGEIIYKEGGKPTGLICLSGGKVKIYKEGVGGRQQIVRLVRPVGFIGFRAMFANQKYSGTALAIEDCSVCVLNKDNIIKVLKTNGSLGLKVIQILASELGYSNNRTITLTQKHIRGRLAESLLFLKDTYGLEDDGTTMKVYLSREDLASLSNMTTSNAIRTLGHFATEKVISIEGRKIKITDLNLLERISELG
ncbi:MAG: Crp/Fnr family transcriptional regulator [Bacteroidales bacterium]|nr:Crp/Fnr family transcriptional regulator [Bacteroidales bacterium]MCF8456916.1 Crp/Fnr family transcriptional regulator [Bacteroidales bacterium]